VYTVLAVFKRRCTESPIAVVSEELAYMQYLNIGRDEVIGKSLAAPRLRCLIQVLDEVSHYHRSRP